MGFRGLGVHHAVGSGVANTQAKHLVIRIGKGVWVRAPDSQSAVRGAPSHDVIKDRENPLQVQNRDLEGTGFGQLGRRRPLAERGRPLQLLQFARFCPEKR